VGNASVLPTAGFSASVPMAANLSAVSSLRRDVKDGNAREKRMKTQAYGVLNRWFLLPA